MRETRTVTFESEYSPRQDYVFTSILARLDGSWWRCDHHFDQLDIFERPDGTVRYNASISDGYNTDEGVVDSFEEAARRGLYFITAP